MMSLPLFDSQLFGEIDPDEDVSPDAEDPEAELEKAKDDGNVVRISTRQWAQDVRFDGEKLFNKFFFDDIETLLKMDKLWAKRKPPEKLHWSHLPNEEDKHAELHDQEVWSVSHCAKVFKDSIAQLYEKFKVSTFRSVTFENSVGKFVQRHAYVNIAFIYPDSATKRSFSVGQG